MADISSAVLLFHNSLISQY